MANINKKIEEGNFWVNGEETNCNAFEKEYDEAMAYVERLYMSRTMSEDMYLSAKSDRRDELLQKHNVAFGMKSDLCPRVKSKKSYKDFPLQQLGCSDIASLTFRTPMYSFPVNFGKDGSYSAYMIEGDAEIGAHYELVKEVGNAGWLKVYDDEGLTFKSDIHNACYTLRVYRAGEMGCIIQFLWKEV